MKTKGEITLYRAAKHNPPTDRAYRTPQDKRKPIPPGLSEEKRRSWDALSAWSTEERARRAALQARENETNLGDFIVRYNVPEGAGITWEESLEPGHYDLRGDLLALKAYLDNDFEAKVDG